LFTFGGGAAMVPFFRQELIEKYKYITEEELMNYYAIGQCTPGIIAVNVATFTGYKIKGVRGACLATFAIILPSIIVILMLASVLELVTGNLIVSHVFAGIRLGVVALVFNEVLKLFKRNVVSFYQKCIFVCVLAVLYLFHISPITAILLTSCVGCGAYLRRKNK
jgi:chromate transporter